MKKDYTSFTTTLPIELVKRLKILCVEEGRKMNFYLERWIEQELKKLGK